MTKEKVDTRYPYTYACDFMRAYGGAGSGGVKLSRADASKMREQIANALGMADGDLATKLADFYLANEEAISEHSTAVLMRVLGDRQ